MARQPRLTIYADQPRHTVGRYLYSHFAEHLGRCIYNGIWVGEGSAIANDGGIRLDTVEALAKLELPALRWPGGCFADNYHWEDGIGPRAQRRHTHNLHWHQPETNEFGTDEFMRFCKLIKTDPYICCNVGSGHPEQARAWAEYCNSDQDSHYARMRKENGHEAPYNVKFWGIGNENWGCGGMMRPEYYADLYARFAGYVKLTAGWENKMIACGSHPGIPDWDRRFLEALEYSRHLVDYIALHNYSNHMCGVHSTDFTEDQYRRLMVDCIQSLDDHIRRAIGVVQGFSTPHHRIGVILDEWGTWYTDAVVENGLYQQNSMQDALFTATAFHTYHEHAEWLYMTNMAQTVNVLQALVLTKGDQLLTTPTYHVYEMYKPHRDGQYVDCRLVDAPAFAAPSGATRDAISVTATTNESGDTLFVSLVNMDPSTPATLSAAVPGTESWTIQSARRLGAGTLQAHNAFENPTAVVPENLSVEGLSLEALDLPARSITTVMLKKA